MVSSAIAKQKREEAVTKTESVIVMELILPCIK